MRAGIRTFCLRYLEIEEMMTFYAQGAYGRKANREDWDAGKDFRSCSTGQYFSKRDFGGLRDLGYTQILFIDHADRTRPVFIVRLDHA